MQIFCLTLHLVALSLFIKCYTSFIIIFFFLENSVLHLNIKFNLYSQKKSQNSVGTGRLIYYNIIFIIVIFISILWTTI